MTQNMILHIFRKIALNNIISSNYYIQYKAIHWVSLRECILTLFRINQRNSATVQLLISLPCTISFTRNHMRMYNLRIIRIGHVFPGVRRLQLEQMIEIIFVFCHGQLFQGRFISNVLEIFMTSRHTTSC